MKFKTVTFLRTVIDHIRQGRTLLTEDQAKERLEICKKCPHFNRDKCGLCGCCANEESSYFNKLAYPNESCPDGRW